MLREKIIKSPVFIISAILIIIAIIYFIYTFIYLPTYTLNQSRVWPPDVSEQTKTYQSKKLKISIQISTVWTVSEKISFIDLNSDKGKINISRIATNFDNANSYLKDFDSRRTIQISQSEENKISGYDSVNRIEIFNTGPIKQQKVYYIYINNWVYSLSTSQESLYNDLDKIAQSFRYLP